MKSIALLPAICCGPEQDPLTEAERDHLAARFKALADPTRVAIVNSLSAADEVCVCNLTATFDLSQPTISHHLKILREAGLVESRRQRALCGDDTGPARARRGRRADAGARRPRAAPTRTGRRGMGGPGDHDG